MANPNTPKYPTSIATDSDLTVASDAFTTFLTQPIDSQTTTVIVNSVNGLHLPCLLLVKNEIILATSNSGTTLLNCVRGINGTTPSVHAANEQVSSNIFAYQFNQLAAEIKAIQTFLGINGNNLTLKGSSVSGDVIGNLPNLTLSDITGLTPGEFFQPILTVDSKGRVVSVSPGTYSQLFENVTTLAVPHFLNHQNVIVSVYDTSGTIIIPNSIQIIDNNNLTITFSVAQSGRVVVK